jgi:PqqA peptide cyclase
VSVQLTGETEHTDHRIPRIDIELSPGCDHACAHCYNVWNAEPGDAQFGYETGGVLSTKRFLEVIDGMLDASEAKHVTFTGGEPLLRKDALDIIEHTRRRVKTTTLITNGSHVGPEVAARLADIGLTSVQLTLLSQDRALHNRLKGAECFDDTVRAALDLRQAGVAVTCCYVAMAENSGHLDGVFTLCKALDIRHLSYNRMSPTGGAIHHLERLMPTVPQIEADLEIADRRGRQLGISVGTAMPIPPCLIRLDRYSHVRFGFCSTGSTSPNIVIDSKANVRSCNLSVGVLGNLLKEDWKTIHSNPYMNDFKKNVPDICRGCAYEHSCQGGCKESGFAVFGDATHPEPLLWLATQGEAQ